MREYLMPTVAALVVILAAEKWLLPAVPDQVLFNAPVFGPVTSDQLALAAALGLGAPKVESTLRGWF